MPTEYSAQQLADLPKTVFLHGVASGDPTTDRVVIWTRLTASEQSSVAVTWEMSRHRNFRTLVAQGQTTAHTEDDFCVHVDVDSLQPDTHYFYRFSALGETSPQAQTKTLPVNPDHLRFAQVSCAKYNAGFFNAYRCISQRPGLDFLLHLGDYIYEASNTPPASQTPGANIGRPFDPLHECKTLDDYRRRYAQYHLDPDVQAMHQALPLIATWDDHEFADGAWRDGASEHKPERDGAWAKRKADAMRAHYEWLPVRLPHANDQSRIYRSISLGDLADVMLIDTRTLRDEPIGGEKMGDPARSALGKEQRDWLLDEMKNSKAKWKILGNPSILGTTWATNLPKEIVDDMVKVKLIDTDGMGPDYDQWDGYPVERNMLIDFVRQNQIHNLVVLSGDIHCAMALELKRDAFDKSEVPVAVEFVNPSLTSQNLDEKMGWKPRTGSLEIEKIMMGALPHIRWCDLDSHGYNVVDITEERVKVEWWLLETVLERSTKERRGAAWQVKAGSTSIERVI